MPPQTQNQEKEQTAGIGVASQEPEEPSSLKAENNACEEPKPPPAKKMSKLARNSSRREGRESRRISRRAPSSG